jgi:methionyl-tRNA formyltransferase
VKIIFAGTPQFAACALEALIQQHEILAVLTQPDRPAGRGMQLAISPVKKLALQHSIPVLQPATLKVGEVQKQLANYQADVMVVAAYGLILPLTVLTQPRLGCLNIHASLLPRWRGAAPIQRAILAGDQETGITIMQMDEGLDTGEMLLKKFCPIAADDTSQTLHDKLSTLGAQAITETLHSLAQGKLPAEAQDGTQANYAAKLSKAEAQLDWTQSAEQLQRAVRAYNPAPVAYTTLNGVPIKVWQASLVAAGRSDAGTVLAINKSGIQVACGQGALNLEILQRPNGKPMPSSQFTQGFTIKVGDRFAKV